MRVTKPRWRGALAVAALCAAAFGTLLPGAAQARRHHRPGHHVALYRPPAAVNPAVPVDAGFGPTAPGPSMILVDAAGGGVISEVGADTPRYPASLTKLMTLDLAFQALRDGRMTLNTEIPVSEHAADVEPVKLGLPAGGEISVRNAILAMTTMSANDAATALGEYLGGGSEDRCAQMMTLRAHALGMAQTQFYNASGLPNPGQVTTARDLSILARDIVISFPQDQQFFEVQSYPFGNRTIYSNNAMLKIYPGATGMKTGYTILARHNLITSAVRDGKMLIGVVLHEPSWGETYQQMTAMLDGGFGGHVDGSNTMFASAAPTGPAAAPTPSAIPGVASAAAATLPPGFQTGTGWTAQIGVFTRMARARIAAINVRQMRGVGFARVARFQSHGRTMWTAQLAGLTLNAAHQTCTSAATRRATGGAACFVIAPQSDHLAMLNSPLA